MEQPCPVQPDAQIGGRYSVRRPLGRAAGCELFDGVQLFTHRAVTLKAAKRSTEADRLLTEARALAQVSHPVLPSVLDALIGPDDQVCVVFEHVRGRSLEGLLTARGRLDADEALHWFRSLADAVGTLHAAGWVGVTPGVSSILLAEGAHQRPVLLDLGPRLRRGAAAEVADDVRHLGALLAEMLERRPTLADELPRSMAALVGQGPKVERHRSWSSMTHRPEDLSPTDEIMSTRMSNIVGPTPFEAVSRVSVSQVSPSSSRYRRASIASLHHCARHRWSRDSRAARAWLQTITHGFARPNPPNKQSSNDARSRPK